MSVLCLSLEPKPPRVVSELACLDVTVPGGTQRGTAWTLPSHVFTNSLIFRDWKELWIFLEATEKDVYMFLAFRLRMGGRVRDEEWSVSLWYSIFFPFAHIALFNKYILKLREALTSLPLIRSLNIPSCTQRTFTFEVISADFGLVQRWPRTPGRSRSLTFYSFGHFAESSACLPLASTSRPLL